MKKRSPGAPTKLTPQVQRAFLKVIKLSGFYSDACAAVGITESTFQNWRTRGEASEQPYFDFLVALKRAEIDRRNGYLEESRKRGAKKNDAREIQWRAQVTDPEKFSIRHHVVFQQQLDVAINRLKEVFSDRPLILEEVLGAIAGIARSGGTGGDAQDEGVGLPVGGDDGDPLQALAAAAGIPSADG